MEIEEEAEKISTQLNWTMCEFFNFIIISFWFRFDLRSLASRRFRCRSFAAFSGPIDESTAIPGVNQNIYVQHFCPFMCIQNTSVRSEIGLHFTHNAHNVNAKYFSSRFLRLRYLFTSSKSQHSWVPISIVGIVRRLLFATFIAFTWNRIQKYERKHMYWKLSNGVFQLSTLAKSISSGEIAIADGKKTWRFFCAEALLANAVAHFVNYCIIIAQRSFLSRLYWTLALAESVYWL